MIKLIPKNVILPCLISYDIKWELTKEGYRAYLIMRDWKSIEKIEGDNGKQNK